MTAWQPSSGAADADAAAGRRRDARHGWRAATANAFLYALLLFLVWGVTAPLHGLWQDDAAILAMTRQQVNAGVGQVFSPLASPLRRLCTVPFALSLLTPDPVLALQAIYGACWLAQALAAGWIAGLLLPGRPTVRLLAVALTLTATGDYLTDNLTSLTYCFGVLTLLAAVGCGLSFLRSAGAPSAAAEAAERPASASWEPGQLAWLLGAAAALAASLWTVDAAFTALPFLPLLVAWLAAERGRRPRWQALLALAAAWGAVVLPAALLEWRFLHDPAGYAAAARLALPAGDVASRALELWGDNFAPWQWAHHRPVWYLRPPHVIPAAAVAAAAALAIGAFALRVRRLPPDPAPPPARRILALAGLFVLLALAANAAYAGLQLAEIHYRTQVLSRVWSSLALAVLAAWAAARWPRARLAPLAVVALFVGLGVCGGLERQDLFLSTWRLHRRELLSIATAAPAVDADAGFILRGNPSFDTYTATQADYLANSWLALLQQVPAVHCLRLAAARGTGCRPTPRGLDCWHEGQAACFADHTCQPDHFDYDRLIVFDLDPHTSTYRLRRTLAGDPLAAGAGSAAAAYRPEALIRRRTLSLAQRRLLLLDP